MDSEVEAGRDILPTSYKDMLVLLFKGSGVWAAILVLALAVYYKSTAWGWSYLDIIIFPVLFILRSFIEWGVHVWLYHAKPMPVIKIRLKTDAFRQHLWHHENPRDVRHIMVTYKGILSSSAFIFISSGFLMNDLGDAASIVMWLLVLGFMSEVVHLICHCDIPHKRKLMKKIVWLHRYHHSHDSDNFYGVSSSLADHLLGTFCRGKERK